jgi:MYXO-CTERM domain-containing protein
MTVDPDFDFNTSAPDVSNIYTAKATFETCDNDWNQRRVKIEPPDGRFWFVTFGDAAFNEGPSALRVEQWANEGPAALIKDNSGLVNKALGDNGGGVGSCGCSSTEAGSAALLSLLFVLWGVRRRRAV